LRGHESAWHWPVPFSFTRELLASATHSPLTLKLKCTLNGLVCNGPYYLRVIEHTGFDDAFWQRRRTIYFMQE